MAKTKSNKPRQMNFADAVKYLMQITDERSDQKFLENSKQFTTPLASLRSRVAALEELVMDKLGETPESLDERVLVSVERAQGFVQVDEPAKTGSIVRIKIKEEKVGAESNSALMEDAFMVVGQKQIHESVDELLIGMKVGETKNTVVTHPKDPNIQLKITIFLSRVFKGREVPANEAQPQATTEAPAQATQGQDNGQEVPDQSSVAQKA